MSVLNNVKEEIDKMNKENKDEEKNLDLALNELLNSLIEWIESDEETKDDDYDKLLKELKLITQDITYQKLLLYCKDWKYIEEKPSEESPEKEPSKTTSRPNYYENIAQTLSDMEEKLLGYGTDDVNPKLEGLLKEFKDKLIKIPSHIRNKMIIWLDKYIQTMGKIDETITEYKTKDATNRQKNLVAKMRWVNAKDFEWNIEIEKRWANFVIYAENSEDFKILYKEWKDAQLQSVLWFFSQENNIEWLEWTLCVIKWKKSKETEDTVLHELKHSTNKKIFLDYNQDKWLSEHINTKEEIISRYYEWKKLADIYKFIISEYSWKNLEFAKQYFFYLRLFDLIAHQKWESTYESSRKLMANVLSIAHTNIKTIQRPRRDYKTQYWLEKSDIYLSVDYVLKYENKDWEDVEVVTNSQEVSPEYIAKVAKIYEEKLSKMHIMLSSVFDLQYFAGDNSKLDQNIAEAQKLFDGYLSKLKIPLNDIEDIHKVNKIWEKTYQRLIDIVEQLRWFGIEVKNMFDFMEADKF